MDKRQLEIDLREWFSEIKEDNKLIWREGVGQLIRIELKRLHHWKEVVRGNAKRGQQIAWIKNKTPKKEFELFYDQFDKATKEEKQQLIDKMVTDINDRI